MLPIYICDDMAGELIKYKNIVEESLNENKFDGEIVFAGRDPYELLSYLRLHKQRSLYFLDVDLGQDINGIELGKLIRGYDERGYISIVTTHDEMLHYTIRLRMEAMDYIIKDKDNTKERITECIREALQREETGKGDKIEKLNIRSGNNLYSFSRNDIYFMEAKEHDIRLITRTGRAIIKNVTLKSIQNDLPDAFFQCHRSCIVNLERISHINEYTLHFDNGLTCKVSARLKGPFIKYRNNYINTRRKKAE